MNRGDITLIGNLAAGDCFYYQGDKKRLAFEVIIPCDGRRKSAEVQNTNHRGIRKYPNGATKVIYLHSNN